LQEVPLWELASYLGVGMCDQVCWYLNKGCDGLGICLDISCFVGIGVGEADKGPEQSYV